MTADSKGGVVFMTNRCYNNMKISKCWLSKISFTNSSVDFNIAVPLLKYSRANSIFDVFCFFSNYGDNTISEENKNIMKQMFSCTSLEINNSIHYIMTYEFVSKSRGELEKAYTRGRVLIRNFQSSGYLPWTTYSLIHWGVTTNAINTKISEMDNDIAVIEFETIDNPPDNWFLQLCGRYAVNSILDWSNEIGLSGSLYMLENGRKMISRKYLTDERDMGEIHTDPTSVRHILQAFSPPKRRIGVRYIDETIINPLDHISTIWK